MKARIINTIFILVGFMTLNISCQMEDDLVPDMAGVKDGYVAVRFNVAVPDMDLVQTKAVDPDGGGVQQISVFCFDENAWRTQDVQHVLFSFLFGITSFYHREPH